jgi:cyclopropane fatty-acyl-phospholipid synthase-like methyltransferase
VGRSSFEGKSQIKEWLEHLDIQHNKVLDIGAGAGTYPILYRDTLKDCKWVGVEIWKDYKVKYGLEKHYDTLLIGDARVMQFNYYDVCFLGDILEHMTKEEAIALVNKLKDTCRYLIISIPIIDYPQDSMHGNPYQAHIKDDWSHKEVMETFTEVKKFWVGQTIGVYLIW